MMKHKIFGVVLSVVMAFSFHQSVQSQTIELLAGNTLNGAMNGTLLGGATMAITNNTDFAPLRVGVGMGTLYGIGMGAYDISSSRGNEILVSGSFNDGNNTSIIVLLDTFYGAAAGAIIASSVMLVANEPLIDGLQYGAGFGAWAGFGFGLVDALTLSETRTPDASAFLNPRSQNKASGLVGISLDESKSFGLISPSFISTYQTNDSHNLQQEISPTVQMVNFRFNF